MRLNHGVPPVRAVSSGHSVRRRFLHRVSKVALHRGEARVEVRIHMPDKGKASQQPRQQTHPPVERANQIAGVERRGEGVASERGQPIVPGAETEMEEIVDPMTGTIDGEREVTAESNAS